MDEMDLVVMGYRGNPQKYTVKQNITAAEFIQKISDKIGIPANEIHLVYKGKELSHTDSSVLSGEKFKVTNKGVFHLHLRVPGGPDPRNNLRLKKYNLTAMPPYISITYSEPCIITFCEPDPGERFAKMPCGHVISPASMTMHCLSLLDNGKYKFECPVPNCRKEWPYFMVRHVAGLTEEEEQKYDEKMIENFNGSYGIRSCPGCKTSCRRQDDKNPAGVCPVCTKENGIKFEFCWFCLRSWKGQDYGGDCGNPDCILKARLQELANCATTTIGYVNSECPSARACPSCKTIIYHSGGCKHMTCKMQPCGAQFCFICLKPCIDGKWECGSYSTKCILAPRQTAL